MGTQTVELDPSEDSASNELLLGCPSELVSVSFEMRVGCLWVSQAARISANHRPMAGDGPLANGQSQC